MMEEVSKTLRKEALYLSHCCMDGNLQSVFSCMDIVWVLYDKIMNWSADKAQDENRDFFIISKGQATLALFPILVHKGLFTLEEIASQIGRFESRFSIQTDMTKFAGGVENNAGSLGHGFPFAVGIAMANKIKKSPSMAYVLVGDGEFCEGTMWEGCIFAASRHLDNLCVIIDDNNSVGKMADMGSMKEKLSAFGFDVTEIDGHDFTSIEKGFNSIAEKNGCPKAVIARTIRGYGSRTMMDQDIWFHKAPNQQELDMLLKEVDEF